MSHVRPLVRSVAAALCAAALPSVAASQDPPRDAPAGTVQESLAARDGSTLQVELGRLEVPENRADPASRTLSLAWMRIRSTAEEPGPPVVMIAGGPGGSSLEMLRRHATGGGAMLLELMGGDLVALDQRGVGASEPSLESGTSFELPVDVPGDRDAMLARIREVSRAEAARWREAGADLAGYTTPESADDLDALRELLGYERVTLWGESYGTHLALETIRRHGEHVARAVLVGPEGPDHTIKLPSQAQEGLEKVGALLAADPEWAARVPDLPALMERVLDRLEAAPVVVDVDGQAVGISRFDAQWMFANWLGSTRRGIDYVPATLLAMDAGDHAPFAGQLLDQKRGFGVGNAMSWVVDSASGLSEARAARIAEEARICLLGDAIDFPFPHVAEAWGAPDLGEAYRAPVRSDVPVLMIAGELDSRTPVRNAEELMATLPNARLIVVENAAHDLNWVQGELREAWSAFLRGDEPGLERVAAPPVRFVPPFE